MKKKKPKRSRPTGKFTRNKRNSLVDNKTKPMKHHSSYAKKTSKRIWFKDFYSDITDRQHEDFTILCSRYNYKEFKREQLRQAELLRDNFYHKISMDDKHLVEDRIDLTNEIIFTIDGNDAKDFDDAVSLKMVDGGYELGVHVADVSHFIKPGSDLDQEAFRRGTSVYLIDQVLPMLPEAISNELCSLVPNEIRYAYSSFIHLSVHGEIIDYSFSKSIIKNKRRCTYQEVEEVLKQKSSLGELDKILFLMNELKTILCRRRLETGSLFFTTTEKYFVIVNDRVESISLKQPLESENLIEEFMLVANICAAKVLNQFKQGIYRIHNEPKQEKLESFERMVKQKNFIMPIQGSINPLKVSGKNRYQIFLDGIQQPEFKKNLSFLLLISMSQAAYSDKNIGHYGLAFKHYTHFTSPIRRYPDLVVHRLIHECLTYGTKPSVSKNNLNKAKQSNKVQQSQLRKIAEWSSECERKAVDSEREYHKIKGMRFLAQMFNQIMDAVVIKVMERGMYVREIITGIEGFVSEYELSPDLYFDYRKEALTRKREIVYELGTAIKIKLGRLNYKKLQIDFVPIELN